MEIATAGMGIMVVMGILGTTAMGRAREVRLIDHLLREGYNTPTEVTGQCPIIITKYPTNTHQDL